MKTLVKFFIIAAVILFSMGAQSQNQARFPQLRERILQAKLKEIGRSLNLDQVTLDKFKPLYTRYEEEVAGINFRDQVRLMKVNPDSLSAKEAEDIVMKQLQIAKKLIDIRERYYTEFKTVLRPQQIIKLYQTETEIRRKVMQELHKRFGGRFD